MKELLPLLTRPSRYTGCEWGAAVKDLSGVRLRLALAFPDLYDVGMSYLGQRILLNCVNSDPRFYAERVYTPCRETAELLRQKAAPLATLETDTPLAKLNAIAFSLTHELCYTNVLLMLDLAGIPFRSAERRNGHPFVLAGGGACFNAEPIAEFFDAMVIGDGEKALPALLERLLQSKEAGLPRHETLLSLAGLPGVYVPSLFETQGPGQPPSPMLANYERVTKAIVTDLDAAPFPTAQPVSCGLAVHDRLTLEIARGCTRGCRFCQAGMLYRPVRERSLKNIHCLLRHGLDATGFEEVSFLSLSTGDFSALDALFGRTFDECAAEQVSISLPSLRVGSLSSSIMQRIASIRRTGITLAPEAGSQRLRDVINKGVDEEALLDHVRTLFGHGWQMVKLYFMIGLPTETPEDLDAILDLCRKVRDAAGFHVKRLQVTAAVSPFVPKPHTPFQWERQIGLEEIRERVHYLRRIFDPVKRVSLKFHVPEMSFLEGVFARGDRRLGPVLERAYGKGAVFSSWKDSLALQPYLEALEECGLSAEPYLAARDPEAPLPWDHLDCGVTKEFLLRERRRAVEGKITEDCRYNACRNCGVCNFDGRSSSLKDAEGEIRPRVLRTERDQTTEAAPPLQDQPRPDLTAQAARFRLWFEKTGPAQALSQLELQSLFERALRRSRLPLSFSAGFHPMPRLSFGMALPVGVESLCEWLAITLRQERSAEDVRLALAPQMPSGLKLTAVDRLESGRRVEQAVSETFEIRFSDSGDSVRKRHEEWMQFLALDRFVVTRTTKRGTRQMDVRPLVAEASVMEDGTVLVRFDWSKGYMSPVALVQRVNAGTAADALRLTKVAVVLGRPAPSEGEASPQPPR